MLTGLLLFLTPAFAQTPGEVTLWTEKNVDVTTEWVEAFANHSWTTACPSVMTLSDDAFTLDFAPTHDGDVWTIQTTATMGRIGGTGYENQITRCLETEAAVWLVDHPVEDLVLQDDNFHLRVGWQHPDAVREPVVREPITLSEDDCENCRLVPGNKSPATLD